MFVSIAMATYNGEKFISKQIDSILAQSYKPNEIVISDDCSSDRTVAIVKEYAEKNKDIVWKIKELKNNNGYIKNFMSAIESTSGDIIILSDQDDLWDIDKVKFYVEAFSKNVDMLSMHTDYAIIDRNDKIISSRQIGYQDILRKYSIEEFCCRLNYCGMSSAFRACLKSELLSLNPEFLPTHDWVIHALAVVKNGMYISDKVTSFRRYTGNNVALHLDGKHTRDGVEQRIKVVTEYLDYYKLLRCFDSNNTFKKYLNEMIHIQENRVEYLQKRNILMWISNIRRVTRYPSLKAFLCDGLYITGVF